MLIFLEAVVWNWEIFPLSGSLFIVLISLCALAPVGEMSACVWGVLFLPVPYFPGEPTIRSYI